MASTLLPFFDFKLRTKHEHETLYFPCFRDVNLVTDEQQQHQQPSRQSNYRLRGEARQTMRRSIVCSVTCMCWMCAVQLPVNALLTRPHAHPHSLSTPALKGRLRASQQERSAGTLLLGSRVPREWILQLYEQFF